VCLAYEPLQAGVIHSDFEKTFVRADVFSIQDLVECGSEREIRAQVIKCSALIGCAYLFFVL
jgi:ribosome-binding ATPase YchF (GTP1/OBG family)